MVVKEDTADSANTTSTPTMEDTGTANKKSIIAQEIKFARALAGNDATMRRRVLKNLKTWLSTRSQSTFVFSDLDFMRLWKGLFYCMWMSDKPLVQEELAESLGALVRCFDHDVPVAMQFFKAFLVTMGNEWFGIDRWRLDKFMMLVRRVTRQAMFALHENGWQKEHVERFKQTINETILDRDVVSYGLMNHFNDLFLNELAKVSNGEIPKETMTQILEVYVQALLKTDDGSVSASIKKNIFHGLMQQSELGQEFEEKFEIWKSHNFVTGNIDNLEFEEQDDEADAEEGEGEEEMAEGEAETEQGEETQPEEDGEEEAQPDDNGGEPEERVFDPRAGRVNVDIPQIDFDPQDIIEMIETYRYKSFVKTKGKKRALQLVKQFTKFANGIYPIGVKRVPSTDPKDYRVDIDEQVMEMEKYRKELVGEKRKSLKELKKERRYQKKLQREAKEAKAKAQQVAAKANDEQGGANGTADDSPDDTTPPEEQRNAGKKRRTRPQKMNPAMARKQAKLELLERKKEEKMKLLKERLKKKKATSAESDVVPQLVPIAQPNGSSKATIKEKKVKPIEAQTITTDRTIGSDAPTPSSSKKKQLEKEKANAKANSKPFETKDEWSEPLKEGEEEYFIPSRKMKALASAAAAAVSTTTKMTKTPKAVKAALKRSTPGDEEEPNTPARKRVKIALNKNVAQDLVEHIKQVKSSPQLPYDSSKKPSKSLLKPNLIPSPINPFYKKKFGLK
uniref:Ribosomal RNA processing protein 1 n=1 Tax=Anopheles epiroticus TaxID=199890 RepID=A0A182P3X7_9DIPT